MLYFTLMAASMGLQQLKTWQDNKQKEALAEKQMEMRKAMQLREFDRARQLQAETAKIAMEMEAEAHAQRRKDIENEYDNVFNSLIDQFQLDKWPLSVVPFIMKGESFGSHVREFDVATVHCILTPSNDPNFNRFVYNSLDLRVEQMMNSYWNSNTTHQIVYYGGAWKPKAPNGVPTLDYSDVEKLHSELKSVPVICITPYFLPTDNMIFRVWVWGMGADTTTRQDITPFAKDFSISLNKSSFIKSKDDDAEKEFTSSINAFINETANYLTAMIGYLTDMYYWKMYTIPPVFPSICSSYEKMGTGLLNIREDYLSDIDKFLNDDSKSYISRLNYLRSQDKFLSSENKHKLIASLINDYIGNHPCCVSQDIEFLETVLKINEIDTKLVKDVQTHLYNYLDYYNSFILSSSNINEYNTSENEHIVCSELDIIDYIERFVHFINEHSDRIKGNLYLYIRKEKDVFYINVLDSDKKIVVTNPNFGYNIRFTKLRHSKNTNYVFRSPNGIVCSFERIPKLKEQILKEQLIF